MTLTMLIAPLLGATFGFAVLLLIAGVRRIEQPVSPNAPVGEHLNRMWRRFGGLRLGAAIGGGVLAAIVTRWPVTALATTALIYMWPAMFGSGRDATAAINRLEALATWTESLRDTIAGSVGLQQAVTDTTPEASPLIRPHLMRLNGRLQAREPLASALLQMAPEFADSSAEKVIAALVLNARLQGQGLRIVLDALATSTREEIDLLREIEAGRRRIRKGSQFVAIFIMLTVGGLVLFSRNFVRPYSSVNGQLVLLIVFGIWGAGLVWMRAAAGQRKPRRFLRDPAPAEGVPTFARVATGGVR